MAYSLELFVSVLEMNIDNRGKTPPLSPTGYPLIEVKHIQEDRLYPVFEYTKYVDQETWDTWFRAHLKPGDILFSTVGSIAGSCMVPENPKFCVAQNVLGFRVNRAKADPRFLYYAINDSFFQQEVRGRTIETVQKSIKVHDLKTCRIPLPPLAEQKAIAKILGDLDDKIELNRKMNTTFEAMARAIFQSWFVDFDPVRAKMDGSEPEGWMPRPRRCGRVSLKTRSTGTFQRDGELAQLAMSRKRLHHVRFQAHARRGLHQHW
ncbi:MAG: restriction endonuclease subunit S [Ignavibacteria bacterium]|nr:restriction endonuclease subunit S [Ignavibacteria bacterium]